MRVEIAKIYARAESEINYEISFQAINAMRNSVRMMKKKTERELMLGLV